MEKINWKLFTKFIKKTKYKRIEKSEQKNIGTQLP